MSVVQLNFSEGVSDADLDRLRAGDSVELTGRVLSLRDASAARLVRALESGEPPPVSLENKILYAVGPSPPKPGQIIGSAGPTTTARMARFFPALFAAGVRGIIGKGELHGDEMAPFVTHRAVYFAAIGGLGALLARQISSATVVAYDDLGPEALIALEIHTFPAVVIVDRHAGNFHEAARARWRRTK
ncbi:MAG TPA: fumarate hydratase C-terminal domain-containing protein [Vicinamibacterales bacterium]|nr:fumarate hydratase C-terminal domain-containing protein [Vicinamibacterales bacterium]